MERRRRMGRRRSDRGRRRRDRRPGDCRAGTFRPRGVNQPGKLGQRILNAGGRRPCGAQPPLKLLKVDVENRS
jgi:hypothetical protein